MQNWEEPYKGVGKAMSQSYEDNLEELLEIDDPADFEIQEEKAQAQDTPTESWIVSGEVRNPIERSHLRIVVRIGGRPTRQITLHRKAIDAQWSSFSGRVRFFASRLTSNVPYTWDVELLGLPVGGASAELLARHVILVNHASKHNATEELRRNKNPEAFGNVGIVGIEN
jgi:hypothetical protein